VISIIAAIAHDNVIGVKNDLPWHLPADLKHFRELTTGKTVVMGYNTYKSIYDRLGTALPNRNNIVLVDNPELQAEGASLAYSLDGALETTDVEEIFVIGGASVYQQAIEKADRLYITEVDLDVEGDAFFPRIDKDIWKETSREKHEADEKNPHSYDFVIYERT
jgi:dihydrofolate reductase